MVDAGTVGVLLQAGTGLLMLLAGLLALGVLSPRRHTVAFSSLLVLWGAFLVSGNLAQLAYQGGQLAQAHELLLLHGVIQGIAVVPLAVFALSYPPSRGGSLQQPLLWALTAVPVAVLATVLVDPTLFHEGFSVAAASNGTLWGPAKIGVFTLFRLGIYAALIRLVLARQRSQNRTERRQALYVALGLMLFVGYESAEDLVLFTGPLLDGSQALSPDLMAFTAVSALGLAVLVYVGYQLLDPDPPLDAAERPLVVVSLLGPVLFGLMGGASLSWGQIPGLQADSVWRLGAVGLLVHGITRFERPEVTSRIPTWAAWLGGLSAAAGALLTVQLGFEALLGDRLRAFVALQGVIVGAAALTLWRTPDTVWAILRRIRKTHSPAGDARRKLEVYEAALLADTDPERLAKLRESLSISAPEHDLIDRLVETETEGPASDPPEEGDLLAGRYRLGPVVGRGAHTSVHRAKDRALNRTVAVKLLDASSETKPAAIRSFLHEARVARQAHHPNVVGVEELDHEAGHPYLVLEHVAGGTLADHIHERGLEPPEAVRILEGVLSGIQHLHDQGLLHRDLKPSNVLVTVDGDAKIADLGLARPWDPGQTQRLGPGSGPRQGTPAYMSPEALMGRPLSPRSDVYAAGAILVEALTGSHYLELEGSPPDTVRRLVLHREPALAGIDPDLEGVCSRALTKQPERRFGSAAEMREALLEVIEPSDRASGAPDVEPPIEGSDTGWGLMDEQDVRLPDG